MLTEVDRVTATRVIPRSVSLICHAFAGEDEPIQRDYAFELAALADQPGGVSDTAGPWKLVRSSHGRREFEIYLYRKRAIVYYELSEAERAEIGGADEFLRFCLPPGDALAAEMKDVLTNTVDTTSSPDPVTWRTIPLLVGDVVFDRSRTEPWIADGVTSFHLRFYDSSRRSAGFVRATRHAILCAGVSGVLLQDIVNLIFQRLLYRDVIRAREIFEFLDSLAAYTVPTELNVYVQEALMRLTVLALVAAGLFTAFQGFLDDSQLILRMVGFVVVVLVLVASWFASRRVRFIRWY